MAGIREWIGAWPTEESSTDHEPANHATPIVSAVWVLAGFTALAMALISGSGASDHVPEFGDAMTAILFGSLFYLTWRATSRRSGWANHVGLVAAIAVLAISASRTHNGPLAVAVLSLFAPLAALVCSTLSFRWSITYLAAICVAINVALATDRLQLAGVGPVLSLVAVASGLIVGSSEARTRRSAMTDTVTGLPNRRALEFVARQLIADAGRTGRSMALVLMNLQAGRAAAEGGNRLDGKSDRFAFEEWMREVAGQWNWMLRGADVVGRLEGDEFVLLLGDCDQLGVPAVVDRLLAVTEHRGVAGATGYYPGDTFEKMLERADRSMRDAMELDPGQIVVRSGGGEVATTFAKVTGRPTALAED